MRDGRELVIIFHEHEDVLVQGHVGISGYRRAGFLRYLEHFYDRIDVSQAYFFIGVLINKGQDKRAVEKYQVVTRIGAHEADDPLELELVAFKRYRRIGKYRCSAIFIELAGRYQRHFIRRGEPVDARMPVDHQARLCQPDRDRIAPCGEDLAAVRRRYCPVLEHFQRPVRRLHPAGELLFEGPYESAFLQYLASRIQW